MQYSEYVDFVKTQKGCGWSGLKQIYCELDKLNIAVDSIEHLKEQIEYSLGRQVLSRQFSRSENTTDALCNQCIAELVELLESSRAFCKLHLRTAI